MAHFKTIDTGLRLLAVDLARQLMPGTLEFVIDWLIDHRLDLSTFDTRYRNDEAGAPAYPAAMLLKLILVAYYSRGIVSSREIAAACRDHVTFTAWAPNLQSASCCRRWRASRSRARSPQMHYASYPVFVHRPAASDWAHP